ncbi:LysR family transcriptional regulator [Leisingera caerulea]|uniref:LysR family transcriptional regulator n=1 Tax=Leisingera caerulea TaxID=506591 RepID=A0ABY5WTJ4_LEICA|nr:LysR family transcriptional regulator [Leisingera caerulea]UWQ57617.1 LysR family transcriptional regulator [Leisingera caerulea]
MHSIFLRYFDEVARHGSIRKAAAVLNVSSTSVNRKINSTEERLGVRLFNRTPDGVELTTIGSIVLEHCRRTLHDYERTKILIDEMRDLRTGHIDIESIDSIAFGILPKALETFATTYPEISIAVKVSPPEDVMEAVTQGAANVGIGFTTDLSPEVRVVTEKAAPIGIILQPDHPLAERTSVTIEDIVGYRLVRTIDARGRNSLVDQVISTIATPLSTHVFTDNLFIAKQMILNGTGIGLYTKIGFLEEVDARHLVFIPLMEKLLSDVHVGVLISATAGMDPAKRLICDIVERALRPIQLVS